MPVSSELVLLEPLISRSCRLRHLSTIMRPSPTERQVSFPTLSYKSWLLHRQFQADISSMQTPVLFRSGMELRRLSRLPRRWESPAQAILLEEDKDERVR